MTESLSEELGLAQSDELGLDAAQSALAVKVAAKEEVLLTDLFAELSPLTQAVIPSENLADFIRIPSGQDMSDFADALQSIQASVDLLPASQQVLQAYYLYQYRRTEDVTSQAQAFQQMDIKHQMVEIGQAYDLYKHSRDFQVMVHNILGVKDIQARVDAQFESDLLQWCVDAVVAEHPTASADELHLAISDLYEEIHDAAIAIEALLPHQYVASGEEQLLMDTLGIDSQSLIAGLKEQGFVEQEVLGVMQTINHQIFAFLHNRPELDLNTLNKESLAQHPEIHAFLTDVQMTVDQVMVLSQYSRVIKAAEIEFTQAGLDEQEVDTIIDGIKSTLYEYVAEHPTWAERFLEGKPALEGTQALNQSIKEYVDTQRVLNQFLSDYSPEQVELTREFINGIKDELDFEMLVQAYPNLNDSVLTATTPDALKEALINQMADELTQNEITLQEWLDTLYQYSYFEQAHTQAITEMLVDSMQALNSEIKHIKERADELTFSAEGHGIDARLIRPFKDFISSIQDKIDIDAYLSSVLAPQALDHLYLTSLVEAMQVSPIERMSDDPKGHAMYQINKAFYDRPEPTPDNPIPGKTFIEYADARGGLAQAIHNLEHSNYLGKIRVVEQVLEPLRSYQDGRMPIAGEMTVSLHHKFKDVAMDQLLASTSIDVWFDQLFEASELSVAEIQTIKQGLIEKTQISQDTSEIRQPQLQPSRFSAEFIQTLKEAPLEKPYLHQNVYADDVAEYLELKWQEAMQQKQSIGTFVQKMCGDEIDETLLVLEKDKVMDPMTLQLVAQTYYENQLIPLSAEARRERIDELTSEAHELGKKYKP